MARNRAGWLDYVQTFTIFAAFILVIACINFMNLATARSERRAREVGIRKSVGSRRHELIVQFMGESVFLAVVAFGIAILLSQLLLPFYNQMVDKQLFIDYASPKFWLVCRCAYSIHRDNFRQLSRAVLVILSTGESTEWEKSRWERARAFRGKSWSRYNLDSPSC